MMGRISAVATALALGACTAQGPSLNAQGEQMELALVQCKAQLGFGGQLQTEVTFDGGVAAARALPFDQITAAQASQINACAAGTQTLSDGLVVVPMTAMTQSAVAAVPAAAPSAAPVRTAGCPVGVTGMYAGTLYCSGGN